MSKDTIFPGADIIKTSIPPGKPVIIPKPGEESKQMLPESDIPTAEEKVTSYSPTAEKVVDNEVTTQEDVQPTGDIYKDLDFIAHNLKLMNEAIQSSREDDFNAVSFGHAQLLVFSQLLTLLHGRTSKLNFIHKTVRHRDVQLQSNIEAILTVVENSDTLISRLKGGLKVLDSLSKQFITPKE